MPKATPKDAANVAAPPEPTLSAAQRKLAVMRDISVLNQDGEANAKSFSFKYVSYNQVVSQLRPIMLRHGLLHTIQMRKVETSLPPQSGGMEYEVIGRFYAADDPSDYFEVRVYGTGVGAADKACVSAQTVGRRVLMVTAFCLPSVDPDIEQDMVDREMRPPAPYKPEIYKQHARALVEALPDANFTDADGQEVLVCEHDGKTRPKTIKEGFMQAAGDIFEVVLHGGPPKGRKVNFEDLSESQAIDVTKRLEALAEMIVDAQQGA